MRKKLRINWKGVISACLAVLITVYTLIADFSPTNVSASTSTDRVTTFINLANSKNMNGEDLQVTNLTEDEIRFLGVYLSNFYIPFVTELGVDSQDENSTTASQMTEALQKNMNFDEDMAKVLVDEIIGLSRSNCRELTFYVGNGDGNYVEVPYFKCNYYNFLRLMLGEYKAVFQGYDMTIGENSEMGKAHLLGGASIYKCFPWGDIDIYENVDADDQYWSNYIINDILHRKYTYGYFAYSDENNNIIPVFDCYLTDTANATPSQIAFLNCLGSVSIKDGYGFSFFDFTQEEIEGSSELKSLLESLGEGSEEVNSLAYQLSIYNSTMCVDCFGNIINKGYNHQYIAVPGCMNPYSWVAVGEDGNDIDGLNAGDFYNTINFQSMSLSDSGDTVDRVILSSSISNSPSILPFTEGQQVSDKYKLAQDNGYKFGTYSLSNLKNQLNDIVVTQDTSLMVKTAWGAFSDFLKVLGINIPTSTTGTIEWTLTRNCYPLRFSRGSSEWRLKTGDIISTKHSYFELAMFAQLGFKDANPGDYTYYNSSMRTLDSSIAWFGATDIFNNKVDGLVRGGLDGKLSFNTLEENEALGCNYTPDFISSDYYNEVPFLDNIVYIDNLGAFQYDNGGSVDYSLLNIEQYLNDKGESPLAMLENLNSDPYNGFVNGFQDYQSGKINTQLNVSEMATTSVYTTYAIAGLYGSSQEAKRNTIGKLGYRLNKDGLPAMSENAINIPSSITDEWMNTQIRNWVFYILHPTKGFDYVRVLVTNKANALLVGWHNDMVGTNNVGAITGTTKYRSSIGYVTTPDLSEIQWTNSLIKFYNQMIPFLVLVMIIVMLIAFITSTLSLQKAIFGVIIFSVFLFLPVTLINNVVGISNRVTQNIYGNKFTYWAIVQQESYSTAMDNAVKSSSSYSNYLRTLYATNNQVYNNQGGDSVVLKWQAPKKMASLMLTENDNQLLSGLSNTRLLSLVLNNNMSGEAYLDEDSVYMYRSYTDIGNFSKYIYNGLLQGNQESYNEVSVSNCSDSLQEVAKYSSMSDSFKQDIEYGYTNPNKGNGSSVDNAQRILKPMSSNMYNDALAQSGTIKDLTINDYVGINQDVFNFSVAMFNQKSVNYEDILNNVSDKRKDDLEDYFNSYANPDKELAGLAAYSLMSESPYYYYSWSLYDQGMSTMSGATGNYRTLLLGKEDGGYFYNTSTGNSSGSNIGNGELKDFMDMKSLFTYIIPYLKEGNDIVKEWDDTYGVFIYDGVPVEEGHQNDPDIVSDPELQQKYWHNLNVARLYEIYTPWVDLMYDCSYADPETISVMGEKYVVEDPINPASYPDNRPMIFSESEMYDYGLSEGDLTEVERMILKCNKQMQERMYDMLNYYNFSDATLNTAVAINCTFIFNNIFSQTSFIGNNIILYPQSFEINDFSYDAFLRFILSNTTDEDLTSQEDFYMALVEKSSTTTAIMYIVCDLASQYALPAFKIFFIIAIFISSILLILITAFRVDQEQKFIIKLLKGLIVPMLQFLLINIGFAWVVSLFMGSGNNAVTQTKQLSIQMGDPVIAMLLMVTLDVICIVLYILVLKTVFKDIKNNFNLATSFVSGIGSGALSLVTGAISGSAIGGALSRNSSNGGSSSKNIEDSAESASSRAMRRGSEGGDISGFEEEDTRIEEASRTTIENESIDESKVEGTLDKINETIKEGSEKVLNATKEGSETIMDKAKDFAKGGSMNDSIIDSIPKPEVPNVMDVANKVIGNDDSTVF